MSRYVGLFITEDPNELSPNMLPPGWAWIKPSTGELFVLNEAGGWDLVTTLSEADHTHLNLDHLADIVTLLGDGVTGSKTIAGYTFTFNHGVLTGFEGP